MGTLYLFFMRLIDMNKFLKNIYDLWNMSNLHAVDYGLNNNKHTFA